MINLAFAAAFLPLSHFLISSTPIRAALVRRLGERLYSAAYSLLALAAFAWLIIAYRGAPALPLWSAPPWVQLAAFPIILLAALLVVTGLTTPNPAMVGAQALLDRPDIARGVLRVSRNPFFWGAGVFALMHIALSGDGAGVLLFGSIACLGLVGAPLLDAKKARRHGQSWQHFAATTSSVPFLAILQGRQRLALREIGAWRILLGVALFLALLLLHARIFGADPLAAFR